MVLRVIMFKFWINWLVLGSSGGESIELVLGGMCFFFCINRGFGFGDFWGFVLILSF